MKKVIVDNVTFSLLGHRRSRLGFLEITDLATEKPIKLRISIKDTGDLRQLAYEMIMVCDHVEGL